MNILESAENNDFDALKVFIENGEDVNTRNEEGYTALYFASINGNIEMIDYLLSKGADVNTRDEEDGFTPLNFACFNGNFNIIELFLENRYGTNVDLEMKDKHGNTPLCNSILYYYAFEIKIYRDITDLLISNGADLKCLVSILDKIGDQELELKVINDMMDITDLYKSLNLDVYVEYITLKIDRLWSPVFNAADTYYPNYDMDPVYSTIKSFLV